MKLAAVRDGNMLTLLRYLAKRIPIDRQQDPLSWTPERLHVMFKESALEGGALREILMDLVDHRDVEYASALAKLPADVELYFSRLTMSKPVEKA